MTAITLHPQKILRKTVVKTVLPVILVNWIKFKLKLSKSKKNGDYNNNSDSDLTRAFEKVTFIKEVRMLKETRKETKSMLLYGCTDMNFKNMKE